MPERPTGCIDTPYIGGDARATSSGIVCGRARSPDAGFVRGRVTLQYPGGLPGPGAEGLLVSLHPLDDGPLRLDALPPARAQATTGPQGEFSLALAGADSVVIVVRATAGGPILGARQLEATQASEQLSLVVPAEP